MDYDSLVQGTDISHWQGSVDFAALATDGVKFDYIKADQNTSLDPMWLTNFCASEGAGILTMAYVFLTANDTQASVDKMIDLLADAENTPIVLDWEAQGVPDAIVELWINGLAGRRILAYYGISPPDSLTALIATVPRILPEYAPQPRFPPWDGVSTPNWTKEWLIWQRSEQGSFQGETGNFDLDVLAVPLERFKTWCMTGKWSAASA